MYRQLNPVTVYISTYYKNGGNPYLKPESITHIELYAKSQLKNHTIGTSIFYKEYKDMITQRYTTEVEEGYNVIFSRFENLGFMNQLGMELNIGSKFFKNLKSKLYLMAMTQHIESENRGESVFINDFVYSGKLTVEHNLGKTFKWILTANYFSPIETVGNRKLDNYFMNLIIQKSFLKNKLYASIQFQDIFHSQNNDRISYSPDFISINYSQNRSRLLMLSASYNFNTVRNNNTKSPTK